MMSGMKKVLFIILALLLSLSAAAQTPQDYHFKINQGRLIWQRVFPAADSCRVDVFVQNLLELGCFKNIEVISGVISCEMSDVMMNYKVSGYGRMELPIYLSNGAFSGHVTIQLKPDRYRVTLSRICETISRMGTSPLSDFALDNGTFNEDFAVPAGHVFDYNMTALFFRLYMDLYGDEW